MQKNRGIEDGLLRQLGGWALIALGSYTVWSANTFFDDIRAQQASLSSNVKTVSDKLSDVSATTGRIDERTVAQERRLSSLETTIGSIVNRANR